MREDQDRPVPERLAGFEIVRRLGVGGMAEVFLAKKRGAEGTFKLLVVKRILPKFGASRRFRAMFAEEAQLATRLNHPNIVQVYDFQDYGDEGQLLSMEYVEGVDLRRVMQAARARQRRVPPFIAAYIIGEVAKGLHYAHMRRDDAGRPLGIVHRDVSPQNILLSFEGAVKIADFGIATANVFREEEEGVLKGKTPYMSPEQARGEKVDARTDIYSLGVVFHELLTGRPLRGSLGEEELLPAVQAGIVEPPSTYVPQLPSAIESIVMRALKPDREERFASARELSAAIGQVLFESQTLIDAQEVEAFLGELIGRVGDESVPVPGSPAGLVELAEDEEPELGLEERTGPGMPLGGELLSVLGGREVRHVAVVALRLHGPQGIKEALGPLEGERFLIRLRATLDEIAFKRGARWVWNESGGGVSLSATMGSARAIVGLTASPSRAASDAAWLAVDVHEAIAGALADINVPLGASIGIVRATAEGKRDEAGHLVDHELRGPGAELAELLSTRAPVGSTFVAGGLYRLLRRDFHWGDAPGLELEARELPRAMRIYSLLRPLTREERTEMLAHASSELVGRDAELSDLHGAYTRVVGVGGPPAIDVRVISGDLGIGKTVLVSAFLNELPPDARILRVECAPSTSELPYAVISELVRQLTGVKIDDAVEGSAVLIERLLGDAPRRSELKGLSARLAELATGQPIEGLDDADIALIGQQIAEGTRRLVLRAAHTAPLVVVVDSVQWCDRPSLQIMADLGRRHDPVPILLLFLQRPDDRERNLLEGFVRLELAGLSPEHQVRLVEARLGVRGVGAACMELLPRAAGNPFFLLEMVDALLERGALEIIEVDGVQEIRRVEKFGESLDSLPSTLGQLIADRLNELPGPERAVVGWLAVAGGAMTLATLRGVMGEHAEHAVASLLARGLVERRGEDVDVRHPLTRDVAYLALNDAEKTRMHRRLAVYLSRTPLARGLSAAVVAGHFARGGARNRAADLYLEAAAQARSGYQTQLAVRFYRKVLDLIQNTNWRGLEAHEALEGLYRAQGRWRDRRDHLVALRSLARLVQSAYWAAMALLRTARWYCDLVRFTPALKAAELAQRVSAQSRLPVLEVQAFVLIAEIRRDLGDAQAALEAMDKALEIAGDPDVPARVRAEVLRSRGTLLRRVGRVHEAVQAHVEAISVFRRVGARRMEARARNSLAYVMFVLGRYEDAIALALGAIRIDLAIGGRFQIAKTLCTIGRSYAALGDVPRALAYLRRARQAHERYADQDARADTLLSTAAVMIENSALAEAEPLIGDAGALNQVTQNSYDGVHERIVRALFHRARGEPEQAVVHAFEARHAAEAQAYVSFLFYAMAIEAVSRVDLNEQQSGVLLATTAMAALETLQGTEYGVQTRALCCEALEKAGAPQLGQMRRRSLVYLRSIAGAIRYADSRARFLARPPVRSLLRLPSMPAPAASGGYSA